MFCVEKFDVDVGNEIKFDNILMLGDSDGIKLGDVLSGVLVIVKVVFQGCVDKVWIIKFCCCKYYMKCQGYCQYYIEIEIIGIVGGSK